MKFIQNKKKTLSFLLITSVVLLFVNVLIDKLLLHGNSKIYSSLSVEMLNNNFEKMLKELRINDEWISKKKIKKSESDSVSFNYYVKIPKDLAMPLILSEINLKFDLPFVNIKSYEKQINKNTLLNILYKNILMLQAQLNIDTNIVRKSFSFAFIIKGIDKLNKNELEEFLKTPEEFCLILIPSLNAEYIRDKIIENQKEYLILLNDDIIDQKYKFDENFSKQRMLSSLREILINYKEAKLYLYDPGSGLFKSPVFSFIKKEFKKRKLKLLPVSKLHDLDTGENNKIVTLWEKQLADKSISNVFLINIEELNTLQKEIELQRLKGNKLVFPSIKNFGIQP